MLAWSYSDALPLAVVIRLGGRGRPGSDHGGRREPAGAGLHPAGTVQHGGTRESQRRRGFAGIRGPS